MMSTADGCPAAPRPTGIATTMATNAIARVPVMIVGRSNWLWRGNHPWLQRALSGTLPRNSIAFSINARMIAALIRTDRPAAPANRAVDDPFFPSTARAPPEAPEGEPRVLCDDRHLSLSSLVASRGSGGGAARSRHDVRPGSLCGSRIPRRARGVDLIGRKIDVSRLLNGVHDAVIGHVQVHERLQRRVARDLLLVDVDVERARQRIRAVGDRVPRRLDAAARPRRSRSP